MTEAAQETTLRDTIANAVEQVEAAQAAPAETVVAEAPVQDAGKPVVDRLRDETGKFVEGKPAAKAPPKQDSAAQAATASQPPAKPGATSAPAAAETQPAQATQPPQTDRYPTTWKRGLEEKWAALDPAVRAEIMRREGDAARGVSVYKTEWDKARPLIEAVSPFLPILQHHKISPDQWIGQLGRAHQALALGTPEQKLQAFTKLAQDYGVPLQGISTDQAQQQQLQHQQQPRFTAPPALTADEVRRIVSEQQIMTMGQQELNRLISDGKHPHYQEVRETMAQLLESGIIPEGETALHDAYEYALSLPKHANLRQADADALRAADEQRQAQERTQIAQRARSQAVSVASSTPGAKMVVNAGDRSLRETLSDAFDAHATGRV